MNSERFKSFNKPHVWVLNIKSEEKHLDFNSTLLSEDEKTKANKFRFKKDYITYVTTRGALRILLGKYLEISPKEIKFEYGEFGKPNFPNSQNLKFNVSHSNQLAVLGFIHNMEIGIDIEYTQRNFEVLDIVENYFSPLEIKAINNITKEDQKAAFYRGWSRKEAFIKANAKGLSFPLNTFSVSIDSDDHAELLETKWDLNEKESWSIIPIKTLRNYKSALAIKGKINSKCVFDFKLETFEGIN